MAQWDVIEKALKAHPDYTGRVGYDILRFKPGFSSVESTSSSPAADTDL